MAIVNRVRSWFGLSGHGDSAHAGRASDTANRPRVKVAQAFAAYEDGVRFIDVREPGEWAQGHIAGAVHHPLGALQRQPEIAVARDKPVITYCASGTRAAQAAAALRANGYRDVKVMDGGYSEWVDAGYPVEHSDDDAA